jgi:adenosylcobinamide-GDP ribazoletransferase
MRDSRIGAHGAAALSLLLMLKWAALESALARGDMRWLVAPVVARFACTLLLALFPYVRAQGLGSAFAGHVGIFHVAVAALGLAATAAVLRLSASPWPALLGIAAALAMALRARVKLGGLTGDVHGAAIELSEAAVLLGASWFA